MTTEPINSLDHNKENPDQLKRKFITISSQPKKPRTFGTLRNSAYDFAPASSAQASIKASQSTPKDVVHLVEEKEQKLKQPSAKHCITHFFKPVTEQRSYNDAIAMLRDYISKSEKILIENDQVIGNYEFFENLDVLEDDYRAYLLPQDVPIRQLNEITKNFNNHCLRLEVLEKELANHIRKLSKRGVLEPKLIEQFNAVSANIKQVMGDMKDNKKKLDELKSIYVDAVLEETKYFCNQNQLKIGQQLIDLLAAAFGDNYQDKNQVYEWIEVNITMLYFRCNAIRKKDPNLFNSPDKASMLVAKAIMFDWVGQFPILDLQGLEGKVDVPSSLIELIRQKGREKEYDANPMEFLACILPSFRYDLSKRKEMLDIAFKDYVPFIEITSQAYMPPMNVPNQHQVLPIEAVTQDDIPPTQKVVSSSFSL